MRYVKCWAIFAKSLTNCWQKFMIPKKAQSFFWCVCRVHSWIVWFWCHPAEPFWHTSQLLETQCDSSWIHMYYAQVIVHSSTETLVFNCKSSPFATLERCCVVNTHFASHNNSFRTQLDRKKLQWVHSLVPYLSPKDPTVFEPSDVQKILLQSISVNSFSFF